MDDWQSWVLEESLAEQANGQWSAFEVGLVVPRQNGKGTVLEARQIAGLFLLRERLQVHSAHEFKTCYEHFLRVKNMVESCPELDARVQRVRTGAGDQAIELKTGERLRFVARSGGSGRGFSGDAVYLDEAYALTPPMIGALLPTLSARPNPQVWYVSSAPSSSSQVLHGVRKRALEVVSPRLFYAEWGNAAGVDPEDTTSWFAANPALGGRLSVEFVSAEWQAMRHMPGEFLRERLGVPEPLPEETDGRSVKIPEREWLETIRPVVVDLSPGDVSIGFDVSLDGEWSSVAVAAGQLSSPYVELVEHRKGTGWLGPRLVELVRKWSPQGVGCNGAGQAAGQVGPVLQAFAEAGLSQPIRQLSSQDYQAACGGLFADVVEGRLRRPPVEQGPLDVAALDASERRLGERWAWDARSASVPLSPLVAVTVARALRPVSMADRPSFVPFQAR